jgi:flagellar motility protein MotE (MotC chaperone)
MLAWIQEGGFQGGVWPTDVKNWVTLIGAVLSIALAIGGVVGHWLNGKLKILRETGESALAAEKEQRVSDIREMTERARSCERAADKSEGRLDVLEREMDKASFERKGYDERLGRLEGMLETMANTVDRHRQQSEREVRAIRESVAEITATVRAFGEMKNDLMNLAGRVLRDHQAQG